MQFPLHSCDKDRLIYNIVLLFARGNTIGTSSIGTPRMHTHILPAELSRSDHAPLFTPFRQKPSPRAWPRCLNLMTRERAGNFATRVSLLMYMRAWE